MRRLDADTLLIFTWSVAGDRKNDGNPTGYTMWRANLGKLTLGSGSLSSESARASNRIAAHIGNIVVCRGRSRLLASVIYSLVPKTRF